MVFEYGFDALELDEIRVRPIETNAAMRGIMERKFGFDGITSLVNQTLDQAVQGQEETTRAWVLHHWVGWSGIENSCPIGLGRECGRWQCATASTDRDGGRG
jgi:hypothetical protein